MEYIIYKFNSMKLKVCLGCGKNRAYASTCRLRVQAVTILWARISQNREEHSATSFEDRSLTAFELSDRLAQYDRTDRKMMPTVSNTDSGFFPSEHSIRVTFRHRAGIPFRVHLVLMWSPVLTLSLALSRSNKPVPNYSVLPICSVGRYPFQAYRPVTITRSCLQIVGA